MSQPTFVEKNKKLTESTDFKFLRNKGIKTIQDLTGNYWTDYNIHDPGVTILEQLCYAITDLGYRTSSDIDKHIFNTPKDKAPFFKPEEILTNKPITIEDYRKIFIDSIPEIKNIWITPLEVDECAFNGLYKVLVDISTQGINTNHDILKEKIRLVFNKFRSVGEDIFEIEILEELPVKIIGDIETDGLHELERILAQIYYKIENSLAPEVKFFSLQELIDKGMQYENIFDGPYLKNGYILTEELTPKSHIISISDIVRGIMQIEGITSVKQLSVEIDGKVYNSQINIPYNKIPRIITKEIELSKEEASKNIRFYKGSLEYTGINNATFVRYLNELVSENKRNYRISESSFTIPTITDNNNFEDYYSIQNHFPAVYGIGPDGISGKPDIHRKRQAKQLKAFLLLFEQVMANYLSQLSHFNELLSIHKKQEHTYFTQHLTTIPNSEDLFKKENGNLTDAYLNLDSIPANYEKGLHELNALFDNYIDRRNRFLDYLLSLHGETFTQHSLQQFNPYYSDKEFDEVIIMCKTALLQNLGSINYNRAEGVNLYDKDKNHTPALIQRIAISLGFGIKTDDSGKIEIKVPDSHFDCFKKNKITLKTISAKNHYKSWIQESEDSNYNLTQKNIDLFDYVDDVDIDAIDISNIEKEKWLKTLCPYKSKSIIKQYLIQGIKLDNYKIGTIAKNKHLLLFFAKEVSEWIVMGEYNTEHDAHIALKILIEDVKKMNIDSEGVKMVEHISLRPEPEQEMFGIYINDSNGNHLLKSNKQYSLNERKIVTDKIEPYFSKPELFSVEADDNREMNIILKIDDLDLEFKSIQPNVSVEETHLQKENLYEFLSGNEENEKKVRKFGFYIQYNESDVDIPEEFFSFQISLLFPNWPARFQNTEFREIAYDIATEQKPANISTNIGWLKIAEMKKIESLLNNLKKTIGTTEASSSAKAELAEFLYIKNYS